MSATAAVRRLAESASNLIRYPRPAESADTAVVPISAPRRTESTVIDAVSVDLEDYYHVEAFASRIPRSQWDTFPSRVRPNTKRTLELLDRCKCRATFFVLGWVAEREPELVRELAEAGHEVACHSHLHRPLHTLKPSEFRNDLCRSREAIERAARIQVLGFRAPTFSITAKSLWALEILAEEGFRYDSSIFPIHHDLYGMPDAPRWAHRRQLRSGQVIWEIPPSTVRVGKTNVPFGGGGYLRLLPMPFTRWAIQKTHHRERQPVIVYFHPWELDPDQPRLAGSFKSRLRHYSGLHATAERLDEILSRGSFQPLITLVQRLEENQLPTEASAGRFVPWFESGRPEAAGSLAPAVKIGQSA